jgi:hypothetical protein
MLIDRRDFTRARLGKLVKVEREACDPDAVIRDADIDVLGGCSVVAQLDTERIGQRVSHLVANAVQHASAKAKLVCAPSARIRR